MWLNKLYLPGYQLIRHFSHLFAIFWPKKIFSCKTAYAIFKVVYQASNIPKIRKIDGLVAETCSKTHIFSHLFRHFWPKEIFSCKTAYAIFIVVYQAILIPKIRKIYGLVAETCSKTHIFHTFFAIFGPKKFFLAKLPIPYLK